MRRFECSPILLLPLIVLHVHVCVDVTSARSCPQGQLERWHTDPATSRPSYLTCCFPTRCGVGYTVKHCAQNGTVEICEACTEKSNQSRRTSSFSPDSCRFYPLDKECKIAGHIDPSNSLTKTCMCNVEYGQIFAPPEAGFLEDAVKEYYCQDFADVCEPGMEPTMDGVCVQCPDNYYKERAGFELCEQKTNCSLLGLMTVEETDNMQDRRCSEPVNTPQPTPPPKPVVTEVTKPPPKPTSEAKVTPATPKTDKVIDGAGKEDDGSGTLLPILSAVIGAVVIIMIVVAVFAFYRRRKGLAVCVCYGSTKTDNCPSCLESNEVASAPNKTLSNGNYAQNVLANNNVSMNDHGKSLPQKSQICSPTTEGSATGGREESVPLKGILINRASNPKYVVRPVSQSTPTQPEGEQAGLDSIDREKLIVNMPGHTRHDPRYNMGAMEANGDYSESAPLLVSNKGSSHPSETHDPHFRNSAIVTNTSPPISESEFFPRREGKSSEDELNVPRFSQLLPDESSNQPSSDQPDPALQMFPMQPVNNNKGVTPMWSDSPAKETTRQMRYPDARLDPSIPRNQLHRQQSPIAHPRGPVPAQRPVAPPVVVGPMPPQSAAKDNVPDHCIMDLKQEQRLQRTDASDHHHQQQQQKLPGQGANVNPGTGNRVTVPREMGVSPVGQQAVDPDEEQTKLKTNAPSTGTGADRVVKASNKGSGSKGHKGAALSGSEESSAPPQTADSITEQKRALGGEQRSNTKPGEKGSSNPTAHRGPHAGKPGQAGRTVLFSSDDNTQPKQIDSGSCDDSSKAVKTTHRSLSDPDQTPAKRVDYDEEECDRKCVSLEYSSNTLTDDEDVDSRNSSPTRALYRRSQSENVSSRSTSPTCKPVPRSMSEDKTGKGERPIAKVKPMPASDKALNQASGDLDGADLLLQLQGSPLSTDSSSSNNQPSVSYHSDEEDNSNETPPSGSQFHQTRPKTPEGEERHRVNQSGARSGSHDQGRRDNNSSEEAGSRTEEGGRREQEEEEEEGSRGEGGAGFY